MTATSVPTAASAPSAAPVPEPGPVVVVKGVATRFGAHVVHVDVDLEVRRAEIFALVGDSGSGKSTLLRELILLERPDAGSIRVLGVELDGLDARGRLALRERFGVLFQNGGLFGSLTVTENVGLPLREHTKLDDGLVDELAALRLTMVGLAPEVGAQFPATLSGGMLKRAALARALILDPELLFLDEPTAGLDPESATGVSDLVLRLREMSGLTIVMITHDLDLLWQVADRVGVLANGVMQEVGSMAELAASTNAFIRRFFDGPRARAAAGQEEQLAAARTVARTEARSAVEYTSKTR